MVKMAFLTGLFFSLPTIYQNLELFSFSLFGQNAESEKSSYVSRRETEALLVYFSGSSASMFPGPTMVSSLPMPTAYIPSPHPSWLATA